MSASDDLSGKHTTLSQGNASVGQTMHAKIDYGYGTADLWGSFTAETVEREFFRHANQCFGIRKSISDYRLNSLEPESLPDPWGQLPEAAVVLKHSGDTIVWNVAGEKVKSEWD